MYVGSSEGGDMIVLSQSLYFGRPIRTLKAFLLLWGHETDFHETERGKLVRKKMEETSLIVNEYSSEHSPDSQIRGVMIDRAGSELKSRK